jgi:hypothetical protein
MDHLFFLLFVVFVVVVYCFFTSEVNITHYQIQKYADYLPISRYPDIFLLIDFLFAMYNVLITQQAFILVNTSYALWFYAAEASQKH